MPQTGGNGLYYWIAHINVFIVVLDAYDEPLESDGRLTANIGKEQLDWLDITLKSHTLFDHKIVVAHSIDLLKGKLKEILDANKIDSFLTFDNDSDYQIQSHDFKLVTLPSISQHHDKLQYLVFEVAGENLKIIVKEKNVIYISSPEVKKGLVDFNALQKSKFQDVFLK